MGCPGPGLYWAKVRGPASGTTKPARSSISQSGYQVAFHLFAVARQSTYSPSRGRNNSPGPSRTFSKSIALVNLASIRCLDEHSHLSWLLSLRSDTRQAFAVRSSCDSRLERARARRDRRRVLLQPSVCIGLRPRQLLPFPCRLVVSEGRGICSLRQS
ncbi:hypothetical protein BD626DRAFT_511812 [Schizophyllum amplum]|uniref:Uncharacterized protein n=1 Tax=Schizophyllum amplum TaxID=97359 RepID=A0A550C0V9_9AGAR|nr:hypothetical protein BD626DRAFT_511812 [Auriculariopsis ampla]